MRETFIDSLKSQPRQNFDNESTKLNVRIPITVDENGIERVVTVALPRLQYRVSARNSLTNTILPTAQPKMAVAIFGFGLTHAPVRAQRLDWKNTIVGQVRGRATTANNKRFYEMSGQKH